MGKGLAASVSDGTAARLGYHNILITPRDDVYCTQWPEKLGGKLVKLFWGMIVHGGQGRKQRRCVWILDDFEPEPGSPAAVEPKSR